ncbi:MAG: response regulator receiver protein [Rariglobus sp.]|jgi:two-component system chemotaxis response regulator CheY|nr:response regulator receiver protein [Rariglobus sp.]
MTCKQVTPMKVLIVDDNDNCIQLLRQVLQFIPDTQVTEASDGCEAWWHLSDPEQAFDLLIADVNMPLVSGLHLTQRIRTTPSLNHLRIVLCTGLHDRKTVVAFRQLGIAHYVVKPFAPAVILEKIKLALASPS